MQEHSIQSEMYIRKKASEHREAARLLREQAAGTALPAQTAKQIAAAERFEALAEELERGFKSDQPVHNQQIFR